LLAESTTTRTADGLDFTAYRRENPRARSAPIVAGVENPIKAARHAENSRSMDAAASTGIYMENDTAEIKN